MHDQAVPQREGGSVLAHVGSGRANSLLRPCSAERRRAQRGTRRQDVGPMPIGPQPMADLAVDQRAGKQRRPPRSPPERALAVAPDSRAGRGSRPRALATRRRTVKIAILLLILSAGCYPNVRPEL